MYLGTIIFIFGNTMYNCKWWSIPIPNTQHNKLTGFNYCHLTVAPFIKVPNFYYYILYDIL